MPERPPHEPSAGEGIRHAVAHLRDQFALCGLRPPLAIVVARGDLRRLRAALHGTPPPSAPKAADGVAVCGVAIREALPLRCPCGPGEEAACPNLRRRRKPRPA